MQNGTVARNHAQRSKIIATTTIVGLTITSCAGTSGSGSDDEVETITLTINSSLEPSHMLSIGGRHFAEQIEERSDGRITANFSDAGALVGGEDELSALSAGTIDIGSIVGSYHTGVADYLAAVFTLPYAGNYDTLQEITRATWDDAQADVDDMGIRLLFSVPIRTEFFFSQEVPCTEPDWSGMRVRAHGGYANEVVEIFGGSPQFMPSSEIPGAIGTNVIDAFSTSLQTWWGAQLSDNAGFICNSDGEYNGPVFYGINESRWEGLDDATQELITEVALEAETFSYTEAKALDEEILAEAEAAENVTIVVQSEDDKERIRERLSPVYENFISNQGERAERYLETVDSISG